METELALARRVVELATAAGASEAEATVTIADRFSVEARDREIAKLEQSVGRSVTVRVFRNGAKASLTSSDLSADGLAAAVAEAVDAARFVAADRYGGLPHGNAAAANDPALATYAADVRERAAEAKIDDAFALERLARETDARVVNSSGSRVADATTIVALANSHGFAGAYRTSQASVSASPVARDGERLHNASYGSAARSYAGLESIAEVARKAAHRATAAIGSRKPPTARCAVIFERDVAATVLSDLFTALNAANVANGNSFLATRVGERVGSERVTIVDDGRLANGLGTSPFDAEGTPTRRTVVFERGTLRTFLYDAYYGRRLGATSTGNAAGGGIGPNNFYLEAGPDGPDALVAATGRGIFVTDVIGFATESVTGTYSRGARGFAIEGGALAYPIDEFTIASNLVDMLGLIDGVANDLVFDQSVVSPTFRIAEMTVSGR